MIKLAALVALVAAGTAAAAPLNSDVSCQSDTTVTTCQLKRPPPLAYSISISATEVLVLRNGPPGPTKIVFRAAQPKATP